MDERVNKVDSSGGVSAGSVRFDDLHGRLPSFVRKRKSEL